MENRFGFRDVVLVALLMGIIIMLGVKMIQDDRQWDNFERINKSLNGQTRDLRSLGQVLGISA